MVELSNISLDALIEFPLFFSAQLLPEAETVAATSIKAWSATLYELLLNKFGDVNTPWCLHIFDPASAESGKGYARPRLIRRELLALLKQKRRSLLRSLVTECAPSCALVQVAPVSPSLGYVSVSSPAQQALCGASLSKYEAGYAAISDDKRPPSRAFKKLQEALSVFNLKIKSGETAVDLGASPGGWTHVLVEHGAFVTAIDRSPLEGALRHHPRVTFIAGNAFTWLPKKPVDWLVCDVITTPERTFQILREWIEKKLCKTFCVTIKFKGAPDLETLHTIAVFLRHHTRYFDGRQLTHNKNEVTVVGSL